MTNLCIVVMQGCITKDAELKKTRGGNSYCTFSIVVNRDVKNGEQWEEHASFFNLALWGNRAEKISPYLKKGVKIEVKGHLEQYRWDDNGDKKSRIDIKVENLYLLTKAKDSPLIPHPADSENSSEASAEEAQPAFDESVQDELGSFDFSTEGYEGDIF
mgnify:CR=1 FL=1